MRIEEYCKLVRPEIDQEIKRLAPFVGAHLSREYKDVVALCLEGGKRLRPILTCLVCQSLGGERSQAIRRGAVLEYVHAASLVLDDLVDGDELRRGRPAVWTLEGVGPKGAPILSTLLLVFGMDQMATIGWKESKILSECTVRMTSGAAREFFDFQPLTRSPAADQTSPISSDEVIRLKTGTLFGASAKLGALAANAPRYAQRAYEYGMRCGEAYQIADDIADAKKPNEIHSMLVRRETQIVHALEAIRGFPENEYTAMLQQAPQFMVDTMLQGNP